MMHIDLHDDKTGKTVRVGLLEDFINKFIAEVGSVTFVVSNKQHSKKATEAIIRVFTKEWDNAKVQR